MKLKVAAAITDAHVEATGARLRGAVPESGGETGSAGAPIEEPIQQS
jgi:hypothetical protein